MLTRSRFRALIVCGAQASSLETPNKKRKRDPTEIIEELIHSTPPFSRKPSIPVQSRFMYPTSPKLECRSGWKFEKIMSCSWDTLREVMLDLNTLSHISKLIIITRRVSSYYRLKAEALTHALGDLSGSGSRIVVKQETDIKMNPDQQLIQEADLMDKRSKFFASLLAWHNASEFLVDYALNTDTHENIGIALKAFNNTNKEHIKLIQSYFKDLCTSMLLYFPDSNSIELE